MSPSDGIWEVAVGAEITASIDDQPGGLVGLGARIEVPVTRAIASPFHFATLAAGIWTVTLDPLLDTGAFNWVWLTNDDPPTFEAFIPIVAVDAGLLGVVPDFPDVDRSAVTPGPDDIAKLLATRTYTDAGEKRPTFDGDTDPTAEQVRGHIEDAADHILGQLADQIDPVLYGRVEYAIKLQAAIFVETSHFRTQEQQTGIIRTYQRLINQTMDRIGDTRTAYDGLS